MKKLLTLTSVLCAVATLLYVTGCASTGTTAAAASLQKETLLQQAGFKTLTVTTPKQKQALKAQQGQQQMAGYADITEETAGPNHIQVQQFNGFGPMGVESLGNW